MENTNKLGKSIYYSSTNIEDKHYFGGFLNLAEDNIDSVSKAFITKFGISNKKMSQLLNDHFTDDLSTPDYQVRVDFLKQHFPVIYYLDLPISHEMFTNSFNKETDRRRYFRKNFRILIENINRLRNFYTHYYHKSLEFDSDFFQLLDSLFLKVILEVKKHKMKDDKTRHLLKTNLNEEMTLLEKNKLEELKEKKSNNKRISLSEDSIKNAVLNDAFLHLLYKDSISREYQLKTELIDESTNITGLSQSGLLFFLGMFLNKKQSEDLRSRVKGFKAKIIKNNKIPTSRENNNLKFMATHWVFSYLGFKGVKSRLNNHFIKETLLIQIVDELSKVPDEVYETLSLEKRKEFIEDLNEYIKEGDNISSAVDSIVIHPIIRKRYEDKFSYFVLRYLDEFVNFPNLRFQINLGNYVHHRQTKNINGTEYQTERVVKEKIKVFAKLTEVTNLKTDFFIKTTGTSDMNLGWEIYPNPSYNFVGGNIPIFINLQKISIGKELFGNLKKLKAAHNIQNKKNRKAEKLNKLSITKLIDSNLSERRFEKTYIGEPTAMLSLNELPSLLYELIEKKTDPSQIENILVEKLIDRFDRIKNYAPYDEETSLSKVTKRLQKSGEYSCIDSAKLIRAIEKEVKVSNNKLNTLESIRRERKEYKQESTFGLRELGREAQWLADDLKRFMPIDSRKEWRGYHHSQLQKSLAYFDQNRNEAFSLLKEFWDFKDDKYIWNKGIKSAFKESKFFDHLYEKYLRNRSKVLSHFLIKIKGFSSNKKLLEEFIEQHSIWTVFRKRFYYINSTEDQINKLLTQPLVFPRGIFDSKPTFIKGEKVTNNPELYANWYQFTYKKHSYQKFYNFDRDYKNLLDKKAADTIDNKNNIYTPENEFLIQRKQDQKIKQVKIQDLFLSLVVKSIFEKSFGYQVNFSLNDLYLTQQEKSEKSQKANFQSRRVKGDYSENIVNENSIWNRVIPYYKGQISEPNIKIKDLGRFEHFTNSVKVKTLLSYDEEKKWRKKDLEKELSTLPTSYEVIRREHIFKELQRFESFILKQWRFDGVNHPKELEDENGNPSFKLYVLEGILKRFSNINHSDINWLIKMTNDSNNLDTIDINKLNEKSEILQKSFLLVLIRNKYAHNQLPSQKFNRLIGHLLPDDKLFESYSCKMLHFVKKTIRELAAVAT